MKTTVLIIIVTVLISINSNAQFWDTTIVEPNLKSVSCPYPSSATYHDKYKQPLTYIPDQSNIQEVTININFNIFQKSDGSGNYQNTQTDLGRLNQIYSWFNSMYSSLLDNSDPPLECTLRILIRPIFHLTCQVYIFMKMTFYGTQLILLR